MTRRAQNHSMPKHDKGKKIESSSEQSQKGPKKILPKSARRSAANLGYWVAVGVDCRRDDERWNQMRVFFQLIGYE